MAHIFSYFEHSLLARSGFVFCIVLLVLLVPWWIVLSIASLGIIIFHPFPEFLVPGILFDVLYGANTSSGMFLWDIFRHTIIFLSVFIIATFIRSRLRL